MFYNFVQLNKVILMLYDSAIKLMLHLKSAIKLQNVHLLISN
ncbi:hypothetical protein PMAG_b0790 [Pseudoalteromonas mariniglutinosa NCIMB 1770]|nr:hypothetical protein [Pseudoalteromonas mariniglutinosa NCIMB 1770]